MNKISAIEAIIQKNISSANIIILSEKLSIFANKLQINMEKGLSFTTTMRVSPEVTAEYIGSGDLAVLATPAMCALMENAAMMAVTSHLEEGQTTVGTALNIEHSRATKVGEIITATAVLTEVNGRELQFNIAARDEVGVIGEGTHTRFIVNREKFMAKLQ